MPLAKFTYFTHNGIPRAEFPEFYWDVDTGCFVLGSNDYPKLDEPPYSVFCRPRLYIYHIYGDPAAPVPGWGMRGAFSRCVMDPEPGTSPVTMRTWAFQGSAEVLFGAPRDFECGVYAHPDFMGVEGTVRHGGSGRVGMASGMMGYVMNSGGGKIGLAVAIEALAPVCDSDPPGGEIEVAYHFYGFKRHNIGVTRRLLFGSDPECGQMLVGFNHDDLTPMEDPAMLAVNGGISAGSVDDPGDGYVHAEEGFSTKDSGANVVQGWTGTFLDASSNVYTVTNGLITAMTPGSIPPP